jgi:hypothetical protein
MALKDRINRDNRNIFMNLDHVAEVHTWNGVQFTCVPDDIKSKHIHFNDMTNKVIFVPTDSLPGRAKPNEFIILDDVEMRVINVIDADGMKEIHLEMLY